MLADVVLAGILAACVLLGVKRGFVRSFLSLFSIVIALILAVFLHPVISGMLEQSAVPQYVQANVVRMLGGDEAQKPVSDVGGLNLPGKVGEAIAQSVEQAADAATQTIAQSVADMAVKVLSMLLVFCIVRLGLVLLTFFLDGVFQLPVLHTVNKLAGGIFGAVSGLLIVYLLLGLLTFVAATNSENAIVQAVNQSTVVSKLYDNNIVMNTVFRPAPLERIE